MSDLKLVKNEGIDQEAVNYDFKKNAESDASCVYAIVKEYPNHTLRELKKIANMEFEIDEVTFENRFNDLKRTGDIVTTGKKKCTISGKTASTVTVCQNLSFNVNGYKLSMRKKNKSAASVRNHDEIVAEVFKFTKKLMNYQINHIRKLQLFDELGVLLKRVSCDVNMGLSTRRGWKTNQLEALKTLKLMVSDMTSNELDSEIDQEAA